MPIDWEDLSMPTDRCSVHMPIIIVNSKLRGAKQDFVPYMVKVILTHIPDDCGVVDPYLDGFLNGSGLAMVLPSYNGEFSRVGAMS